MYHSIFHMNAMAKIRFTLSIYFSLAQLSTPERREEIRCLPGMRAVCGTLRGPAVQHPPHWTCQLPCRRPQQLPAASKHASGCRCTGWPLRHGGQPRRGRARHGVGGAQHAASASRHPTCLHQSNLHAINVSRCLPSLLSQVSHLYPEA